MVGFGRVALWGALVLPTLLAACAAPQGSGGAGALVVDSQRQVERRFSEAPFERGPMAVVAPEGPEIRTWRLVPCRGGATVCAWSEGGPAGRLTVTPDWVVVDGLYGKRFWLSYAGDGYVQTGRTLVPLAWNSAVDGTGDGLAPSLESTASHR